MIEMMVTIGAIRCANHHHQHTNTQLFTERMPSCRQTNSVKALKKRVLRSQRRMAVLHCCKGDAASQWQMAILGVSELCNP